MAVSDIIYAFRTRDRRQEETVAILLLFSFLIATFLRVSLLILYPFIALFIASYFRLRISRSFVLLTGVALASFLLSLFDNLFLKYKLLSLYHLLPMLLLLFAWPTEKTRKGFNQLNILMGCLTIVALINNTIGLVQTIRNPASDDSFVGIYSEYSVSLNGLAILNSIIFFYYFLLALYQRRLSHVVLCFIFLASAVLGFYGAGLVVCMIAFILSFFSFTPKAFIKTFLITVPAVLIIYFLMWLIKPATLDYNISNLKKIIKYDLNTGPRKIKSFYNYFTSYPYNAKDLLLGSGPGTFNSRSAFMVGSPSYFTAAPFIKDADQPYYFKHYAYSLWNDSNTSKALYLDGFRNQPFSSVLALLGEYGLIFSLTLCLLYYLYYRQLVRIYHKHKGNPHREVAFRFLKFLMILLPLLLLIDNFYEYPEIMLPILLALKLGHAALLFLDKNEAYEN